MKEDRIIITRNTGNVSLYPDFVFKERTRSW